MNWSDFQAQGYNLTEAEIKVLSKQVIQQYQAAYEAVSADLKNQYAKILTGVKPEDYYNEMMKYNRLDKMQKEIKKLYLSYSSKSGLIIENISYVGFTNEFYRAQYEASWLATFPVGIMPRQLAEFAVLGSESSWKAITKRIEDVYGKISIYKAQSGTLLDLLTANARKELTAINNAITQGLLQGKSYPKVSKDLKAIIGEFLVKQGKVNATGAMSNAMRIIRTETSRAMNAGHYANSKYIDSKGIKVERQISSVLDNRTRAQSAQVDKQRVKIDEPFIYPGGVQVNYPGNSGVAKWDINDRETTLDIIDGHEPAVRIGRNPTTGVNETFSHKDFQTWAKEQGLKRNKYGELLFPENK